MEVALRELFESRRLAELAAVVDEELRGQGGERRRCRRGARRARAPLSFAQQRLWFLDQIWSPEARAYNMPFGLRLKGELDVGALEREASGDSAAARGAADDFLAQVGASRCR